MILAPTADTVSQDHGDRENLIARMQELRGRIYLHDGAIRDWDLRNGRHHMPADSESWHILLQAHGEIRGCVRARMHRPTSQMQLGVSKAAVADDPRWGKTFTSALRSEITLAQQLQVPILEVGGLAIDSSFRGSTAILQMVFAIYGLAQSLGGAIGISTVTKRHQAAMVLRRLGGQSLSHEGQEVPAYFDPSYGCEMELLKFYSWSPRTRHQDRFAGLQEQLFENFPPLVPKPNRYAN